jgi:hypothetical protein
MEKLTRLAGGLSCRMDTCNQKPSGKFACLAYGEGAMLWLLEGGTSQPTAATRMVVAMSPLASVVSSRSIFKLSLYPLRAPRSVSSILD